jgi:hypothetical protein
MKKNTLIAGLLVACFCQLAAVNAADDKKVIEEKFDAPLSKTWTKQKGTWKVEDGKLKASQVAADEHIAAFRYMHPIQDAKITVKFRFAGAKVFHVGFDPAPGELDKQGHLFAFVLTPEKTMLQVNRDKSDPNSKNEILGTTEVSLQQGTDYVMTIVLKGNTAEMTLTGESPGRSLSAKISATHPSFHVKKPGIVFRVGGKDDAEIQIDSVTIEE